MPRRELRQRLAAGLLLAFWARGLAVADQDAPPVRVLGIGGGASAALEPAKPVSTLPSDKRRILSASPFMIELPSVTWPSPPMATTP